MRLVREVPLRDRHVSIGRICVGLIAATTLTGVAVADDVMRAFGESKVEIGRGAVRTYAREAYPLWRLAHPEQTCPAQLDALNDFMFNADIIDPWGGRYEMYCDSLGMLVYSLGEDGVRGTPDDLWSSQ